MSKIWLSFVYCAKHQDTVMIARLSLPNQDQDYYGLGVAVAYQLMFCEIVLYLRLIFHIYQPFVMKRTFTNFCIRI